MMTSPGYPKRRALWYNNSHLLVALPWERADTRVFDAVWLLALSG